MRLPRVENGHGFGQKIRLGLMRLVSKGHRVPDVARTLLYRGELFGKAQCQLTEQVMRGPSSLTVAERELIAAVVSGFNQCPF